MTDKPKKQKTFPARIAEESKAAEARIKELRTELSELENRTREISLEMQELNQKKLILAHEMKGEEIALSRLKNIAEPEK